MADEFKIKAVIEWEVDEKQIKWEAQEAWQIVNDNLKIDKIKLQMDKSALEKELKNLVSEMDKAKARWDKDLEFYATLEAKSVINQISQIDKQIEWIDKKLTWWNASWNGGLLWKLKSFVAKWAVIAWVTSLWKSILQLWMNAEQARISFTTMLWSAEDAEALLSRLSDFAKKTPFELTWIRESAKQLLAMWVSAEEMIPTLKALWDVSAWLNVPLERLALNYGQVLTQWKLTWKELKDFTTAWVPLLDELAKNLWKTKTEIQDMVSAWVISSKDMVEAFKSMTEEWWRFANLMEAQSQTLEWQRSNFKDTLAWIGEQIWLAVIPALTDMVQSTANATEDLNNMWDTWLTASESIAWGIQIVINWIRGLVKVLQSFWTFFWTLFSSIWTLASGVFKDLQTVTVNLATNSKDIFSAMWDNIKTWILKWVQSAINWINKLLEWAKDKIWVNLGSIWPITTWEYRTIFWDDLFKNTKNAIEWINLAWDDAMNDIWESWSDFAEKVTKEQDNIKKTFRWTAKDITKSNKWALQEMINDISWGWSWWGGGWWKKSVKWAYEELWKEIKDLYNDMDSSVNEHQKKLDTAKKNIEKVEEQYQKLRDTAKKTWEDAEKSIKSYNEQLEKSQADAITNLGQRYVELQKELMWTDELMKKRAEELDRWYIKELQEIWTTEYKWYELKDLIELKEKLEEIKLIEENTTEEQRKSDEFIKKTSKAQEILNNLNEKALELEQKKATAIEKQAIAQSMMDQENWKQNIKTLTKNWEDIGTYYYDIVEKTRKKIEDEENIQYAKQLENQSVNLKDQLDQYTQEKNEEVEILVDITARKEQLETEYTKVFQEQAAKQKQSVDDLIQRWEVLIAKKNEYYWTSTSARAYGWDITNAKVSLVWENWPEQIIARTASYIQPRNASNTYSTVNNTTDNSFSINWMQVNVNNIDEFLDDLRWRLTYRD